MNKVDVRAKLAELGLELPVAAKPVAAYVPAIRTGNLVFTAGQLPLAGGEMAGVGKVDGEITQQLLLHHLIRVPLYQRPLH
jgi:enamine deaminase RidA (YjgF/YER057c/UK114 family)